MDFNQAENKDEETMLRDFIRQEIGEHFSQLAKTNSGNDAFYRQQAYIDTLVKVHSVGHRADKEIDEAIEKLKELTYQG